MRRALPIRRAGAPVALAVLLSALPPSGSAEATTAYTGPVVRAPDAAAAAVVAAAKSRLGATYVYGATGPSSYDCSGLTSTVWRTAGRVSAIPRTSAQQQAWAVPLPPAEVLPGDLIFFGLPVTHVGLALGGGWMLDASSSRHAVVARPLWADPTIRYGRVRRAGMPAVSGPAPAAPAPRPAPAPTPHPAPAAGPVGVEGLRWSGGQLLPAHSSAAAAAGSARADMTARIARSHVGARFVWHGRGPGYDDVTLVTESYRHASGRTLPSTRSRLVAAPGVPLSRLRTGDLVVYGTLHVGVYVGRGYMVDASLSNGRVLQRRVYYRSGVRFVRVT